MYNYYDLDPGVGPGYLIFQDSHPGFSDGKITRRTQLVPF